MIVEDGCTEIGFQAFSGWKDLTSITIPSSVTSIGGNAFYYCSGLTSVIFENPNGWIVSKEPNATDGRDVTLTDPAENAKLLHIKYAKYNWFRK